MKKIYRVEEGKMVAGVCAGIAEAFSFDASIVRLATVFACVATGFFPLAITYVVGIFVIPQKPHAESPQ
ncbi:MAG: PspC domain-containing protein [Chitinivibrionales bacterium]|nr:PspC domain-containing protein [Chitinivibrionales bacterium]